MQSNIQPGPTHSGRVWECRLAICALWRVYFANPAGALTGSNSGDQEDCFAMNVLTRSEPSGVPLKESAGIDTFRPSWLVQGRSEPHTRQTHFEISRPDTS